MIRKIFTSNKILFILIIAAIIRLAYLSDIPFRVDGDAARTAIESDAVWQNKAPLFATGWTGVSNLIFYVNGIFLFVFGQGVFASRIFSSLQGILAVFTTYVLASLLFNKRVGLYSLILITFLPFHIEWSQMGLNNIEASWMLPLVLISMYLAIAKERIYLFILTGIFLGISQYGFLPVRIIPLVFIISFFAMTYRRWAIWKMLGRFLLVIIFALIVYLPMIGYYHSNPDAFLSRMRQVDAFHSSSDISSTSNKWFIGILKKQLSDPVLVFFHLGRAHPMNSFMPYFMNIFESILFSLGLIILCIKAKKSSSQIILFWLATGVVLGGILTVDSPQAGRYVILIPAMVMVMGFGLWQIDGFLKRRHITYRRELIAGTLCILAIYNIFYYWKYNTYDSFNFDNNTQIATYAGRYLMGKTGDFKIYFLGDGNMYYTAAPTLRFLTKKSGIDIYDSLSSHKNLLFENSEYIILPQRQEEISVLENAFPKGKKKEFRNPLGVLLFYLYET